MSHPQSRRILALLLCGTTLTPLAAIAQTETTALAPIVVDSLDDTTTVVASGLSFGGKIGTDILDTAASISVVTAKELQQRGVTNTEQALQYSAGIVTDFYGSEERWDLFKIRGFDAATYRDGLRLGASGQGGNSLREEVYAYERVEILKGADSTLFGAADPGGMVNYVTKLPRSERFGEAYATVGSFQRKEVGVDFGDTLNAEGILSYRFTALLRDSDTEMDYGRNDAQFLMGGLTWAPTGATSVSVVLDYMKRDGTTNPGLPYGAGLDRDTFLGEPDFNYTNNERRAISLLVDHDFGGGLSFAANARYEDTANDFGFVFLGSTPTAGTTIDRYFFAGDRESNAFTSDARLTYAATFGTVESSTTAGVQYVNTGHTNKGWYTGAGSIDWANPVFSGGLDLSATAPYQNILRKDETKAIYLQQQLTFSERFIATAGLRHDWIESEQTPRGGNTVDGDLSETTARLGLTYKITPELSAYASFAQSVVPASTLTMEPEEGEQKEIGLKYRPDGMNALFTASVYDLTKKNITRTDAVTNIDYLVGEVRARGFELEARAEVLDGLDLIAAYAYTDTEIRDALSGNGGNEVGKVPNHLASLWANYTLQGAGDRGDVTFGLGARYTGTYFNADDNAPNAFTNGKSEAAVIYDAAFSYEFAESTTLSLNVSNLFDEKHDAGGTSLYYNPGREISATLRKSW